MKTLRNLIVLAIVVAFSGSAYAANTDNPNGCKPTGLFGQFVAPFSPFQAAASQTIVEGDPVKLDGSGQVVIGAATDSSLLGFARTAVTDSDAGDIIYVYNDPEQVYECQCSGTFALTMIGDAVDLEGSTGIFEVNENASTYQPVRIVGYNANDSVGANTRLFVRLNMSILGGGSAGVFDDLAVLDDLTVADDASVGGDLTVTGAVEGGTVTDGTVQFDGSGNISGALAITASGAIEGGSITDGTATLSGGEIAALDKILNDSGVAVRNAADDDYASISSADHAINGDLSVSGHRDGMSRQAQACYGSIGNDEWEPGSDGGANFSLCALPASITAKYGIMLCDVAVGDEITGAVVAGYCTENNAITLDVDVVKCAKADGACSVVTATTGFVQVDSCAAAFDQSFSVDAAETVTDDYIYGIRLLGTTGATDAIAVSAAYCAINAK